MIINHQYRFIFLKTRKTAGTSIEIALSQFCGEGDVLARISEDDEQLRQQLGFTGPQNHQFPLTRMRGRDWLQWCRSRRRPGFRRHASIAKVRKHVPRDIWKNYFKFCFERNPFDKAISRYYWSTSEPRPAIADYLDNAPAFLLSNWNNYTVDDQLAVDFVGRYENLEEDLTRVVSRVGLPGPINLPLAKAGVRKNRDHYCNVLNAQARSRIESVCAKEIAAFNYQWCEPSEVEATGRPSVSI